MNKNEEIIDLSINDFWYIKNDLYFCKIDVKMIHISYLTFFNI